MKSAKKIFAIALAAVMLLSCVPSAFAATSETAIIDHDAEASLTIYAFDWTNAYKDGVVDEDTFVSSGWQDSVVEDTFIQAVRVNGPEEQALGNGQFSNGYAIKGVEYTILKIADPLVFNERIGTAKDGNLQSQMLYRFEKNATAGFFDAIGFTNGAGSYDLGEGNAAMMKDYWYYTSDTLNLILGDELDFNATNVKNGLEEFVKSNGGIQMDLTDEDGRTSMDGLDVGLYLVVETAVPEMVTSTTNPFLISLPMTTVNNNTEGSAPEAGHEWNYDVTVYPKSFSGIPTLEKTVREDKADSGTNKGTDNYRDGYYHNATGSAGDTMQFQFMSTLPTITSSSTALTCYNFFDTMEDGMTYNKDVKIEIFSDKGETLVTTWTQDSGKFTVTYSEDGQSMTVDVTKAGLDEINGDTTNTNGSLYAGYSNYTMRVSYSAEIDSDASFTYGADGNCNKVVLTWKRTSSDYYDTLIDDAHVFSFGLNLTKLFSDMTPENADAEGKYEHVKFVVKNNKHNYWLTAELNDAEGIYYVTGFTSDEAKAAIFTPVTSGNEFGKVIIRGVEDDAYSIYEIETADGYTLLDDCVAVTIEAVEDTNVVCDIYSEDILGLLQNDPRYSFVGEGVDKLTNIPQTQLSHSGIMATAFIENDRVIMHSVGESKCADAPVTIINTRGFDLPQTGDNGVWMFGVAGGMVMLTAVLIILFAFKKKEDPQTMQ